MKQKITHMVIALGMVASMNTHAQNTITFDTFTLSANSFYQDSSGTDFISGPANFRYGWNSGGGYWESGAAYTNKLDTTNGTYTNLYGCIPGAAFSGANYATLQDQAIITFSNTSTAVTGFYITNTTFAWKTIKTGNQFARKFGDTTGTKSGGMYAQGAYPDWFKVIVKGYRSGAIVNDSVQFYLADYRPAGTANDYVVKNWQYVNCSTIGQVDSIQFVMRSSDNSFGFMNTPSYFSIDNLSTAFAVGVNEAENVSYLSMYPNPSHEDVFLNYVSKTEAELSITVYDITGKAIIQTHAQSLSGDNTFKLETSALEAGVYFIELKNNVSSKKIKFIKL